MAETGEVKERVISLGIQYVHSHLEYSRSIGECKDASQKRFDKAAYWMRRKISDGYERHVGPV